MRGKIRTLVHIFNCHIDAEFDAELLPDGSLKLIYHEPLIIPKGTFELWTLEKDWR